MRWAGKNNATGHCLVIPALVYHIKKRDTNLGAKIYNLHHENNI